MQSSGGSQTGLNNHCCSRQGSRNVAAAWPFGPPKGEWTKRMKEKQGRDREEREENRKRKEGEKDVRRKKREGEGKRKEMEGEKGQKLVPPFFF